MQSRVIRIAITAVGLFALFTGILRGRPVKAADDDQQKLQEAKDKAKQIGNDMIVLKRQIPQEQKPESSAGPPAKSQMIMQEVQERYEWLRIQQQQLEDSIKRAENARNSAEAQVFAKDALLKAEAAESLKRTIVGPSEPAPGKPTQNSGPMPNTGSTTGPTQQEQRSRIRFRSGALDQLEIVNQRSQEAAASADLGAAKARSTEAFGSGRAGNGGVSLYLSATVLTPLQAAKMKKVFVENGRLTLLYDGRRIRFPLLDPEFLALAVRSVYGSEGVVRGTVLANEENAIVLSTGKEQYGDVVWKKEFLPRAQQNVSTGQQIGLDLGPSVGVLSLPDPSYDRVTYYGPLRDNSLGHVLQESDMVFSMFWFGVDWKTGMPIDPAKLEGYYSAIDLMLSGAVPPRPKPSENAEKPKNWWDETVWFVWVPQEISLEIPPNESDFEFTKADMRVVVWSAKQDNVSASHKAEGEYLTKHYDDFCRAFPVLSQLREAAKAVAIVRWLNENKVPMDLGWAKNYQLSHVDTPDKFQRISVSVYHDKDGKPLVEAQ
jgi:hypothetical protein